MSTLTDMVAMKLLKTLDEKPRLSPSMLKDETGLDYQYIKTTLRTLAELGLVETPSRGVYVLTKMGRRHLQQFQASEGSRTSGESQTPKK